MSILRAIWTELCDFFGFNVPADVSSDMPKSLDEYRRRREINERLRREAGR